MEITGTVKFVKREEGTTQTGRDWVRFDVLVNYMGGDFPKDAMLSFNGEKFKSVMDTEGKTITANFDINSRMVSDKYYTRLDAYRFQVVQD